MTRLAKLLMTGLTVLLLLSLGASTSFALRSISLEGETRLTLTGTVTAESEAVTIRCNVTVVKTISRAFPKTEGILIGKIIDYRLANCVASTGTINSITILGLANENLWRIFFKQFLGTLPSITGLLFEWRNVQKLISITILSLRVECLYEGSIGLLAVVNRGILERLRTLDEQPAVIEKSLVRDLSGSGLCPSRIRLKYSLTPQQNTGVRLL